MSQITEVVKLRRKVLTEVAKLAYNDQLEENVESILTTVVTEDGPRYRCCVHKERAVLRNRIDMALSQPVSEPIVDAAKKAVAGEIAQDLPIVNVLTEACDQCPIDKFIVTDACRNCIAHHCMASCPKKAITVHQNRAYIDKTKCVECGMCKKACPYGAIIEISRPCERACDLGAIKAGQDRKAVIDYDRCVQCGSCKTACPFGAIGERSYIVQLIQDIKHGKHVVAMVAPAFVGQFGVKVTAGQLVSALHKMGFKDIYEVALGADMVTLEETHEFLERVPEKQNYMTTSCCPAFVGMIEKHLPELKDHISSTVSPMIATGRVVKKEHADAVTVFIGPCTAKKAEAQKYPDAVDYVLTYEELAAMFVGLGINVTEMPDEGYAVQSSRHGAIFARAGGVLESVQETAAKHGAADRLNAQRCAGLANCKQQLMIMKAGRSDVNFLEGMGCEGGCVGGPGTLTDMRVTSKLVDNYANTAEAKLAEENETAQNELKQTKMHRE